MKLYFAWIQPEAVFDPGQHARQDERILDLRLSQEEGQPAILHVSIPNTLDRLDFFQQRRVGLVSVQFQEGEILPLFKGRLISFQATKDPACLGLILEASPDDLATQMEKVADAFKQTPDWDPLFVDPDAPQDPKEVEKIQPLVFHVDRQDHQVALTSFSEGTPFKVGGDFFVDSLRMTPKWVPASGATLTLEAQWVQQIRGFLDMGRRIAQLFPEKIINTFTGKALQQAWPRKGQSLGRSGYWVASSRLEEIFPTPSLYPATSQPLRRPGASRTSVLKRFWFKARLIVGWEHRQKRLETLTFTLKQHLHPAFIPMSSPEPHRMSIRLQDINPVVVAPFWEPGQLYDEGDVIQHEGWLYRCKQTGKTHTRFQEDLDAGVFERDKPIETPLGVSSRDSFFVTDRGVQSFQHALNRVRTYLAHQARCLEVSFAGTWERLCALTLRHQVSLTDPRLPGGKIQGKVTSYTMVADPTAKVFEVRVNLGVSVGAPAVEEVPPETKAKDLYALDYSEPAYTVATQQAQQDTSGIWFERYDHQRPKDVAAPLVHQEASFFIKKLNLKHGGQEQATLLKRLEAGESFQGKDTQIQIKFMPLKKQDALKHAIRATLLSNYRAPCHL